MFNLKLYYDTVYLKLPAKFSISFDLYFYLWLMLLTSRIQLAPIHTIIPSLQLSLMLPVHLHFRLPSPPLCIHCHQSLICTHIFLFSDLFNFFFLTTMTLIGYLIHVYIAPMLQLFLLDSCRTSKDGKKRRHNS